MSVPTLFSSGGIVLNTPGMDSGDPPVANPKGFAALVSQNIDLGTQFRTLRKFAEVYESQVAISRRSPSVSFGTTQIASLLDLVGGRGLCIRSDGTHPGLDAYLLKHDECDGRDKTDSERYRIARGYLMPQNLTANHGEVAAMTATAIAVSDGGNEPLAIDSVAIPATPVLADTEAFGLVKQSIGGIDLQGVKGLSIDFGVEVQAESADGATFPEWVSVGSVATRITLSGINPRWLAASQIPLDGRRMTHANTKLRLARYATDEDGVFKSATALEHIEITVAGLGAITTAASASDETTPAGATLQLIAIHDGTNVPLLFNTAAQTSL